MKTIDSIRCAGLVVAWMFTTASTGLTQLPSLDLGAGLGGAGSDLATMTKLFGSHTAFTAKSDVRVYDKNQKETISTPMDFSYLDKKIRIKIDMTQMKNKEIPAGVAEQLKQFGMDQVVSIVRPDRQKLYVLYPKLQSCVVLPMPKTEAETTAEAKLSKQAIGKESLDGHPCVKHKVTLTSAKGEKQELTVWNATDLKDFPVQILTAQNDDTVITRYRQIRFTKPSVTLFDPPANYTEYSDMQTFVQGVMTKILGGVHEAK